MKKWLFNNFLPMWAKETVLAQNRQLLQENEKLRHRVAEMQQYIAGMQAGVRSLRKISIYGGQE